MIAALVALWLAALQGTPEPMLPPRPHDPWVFRSVLDGRPRVVTIALDAEMWIAYDATTCGLVRAWKGGVDFEGAVYTTEHGPQPVSRGPSYVEGYPVEQGDPAASSIWDVTYARGPEMLRETVVPRWRGYRLDHLYKVTLLYDLPLPGGEVVRVEESPEYARPMDRLTEDQIERVGVPSTHPGLVRVFRVIDPPEGYKLSVKLRTDGGLFKQTLAMERERLEDIGEGPDVTTHIHSRLVLGSGRKVNYLMMFFEPRTMPERLDGEKGAR